MTNREREFAKIGFEYAEGIENAHVIIVPGTGREIRKQHGRWEAQPWNDNYWKAFDDLLDAAKFATPPGKEAEEDDDEKELGFCCMSLCEWDAIVKVTRPDGSKSDLCAQCKEAYDMGLNDGVFNDR